MVALEREGDRRRVDEVDAAPVDGGWVPALFVMFLLGLMGWAVVCGVVAAVVVLGGIG